MTNAAFDVRVLSEAECETRTAIGHKARIFSARIRPGASKDELVVATASEDGNAIVWRGRALRRAYVLEGHSEEVLGVEWSNDGTLLTTASADNTACVWRIPPSDEVGERPPSKLTTVELDDHVYKAVADVRSASSVRLYAIHGNRLSCWDVGAGQYVFQVACELRGHVYGGVRNEENAAFVFDLDVSTALTTTTDGDGTDASTRAIALACSDGSVRVHDAEDGSELLCAESEHFHGTLCPHSCLRWAQGPDGRTLTKSASETGAAHALLVCGSGDGSITVLRVCWSDGPGDASRPDTVSRVWGVGRMAAWQAHNRTLFDCLALSSRDGAVLEVVTCSGDGTIKLWTVDMDPYKLLSQASQERQPACVMVKPNYPIHSFDYARREDGMPTLVCAGGTSGYFGTLWFAFKIPSVCMTC